jgi:hypothetical protein
VGNLVHFEQRIHRSAFVASDQRSGAKPDRQTLAQALERFAKPRLWSAVEHLETALAVAENIGAGLPAGSAKSQFELERDMLVKNLAQLRERIRDM